MDGLQLPGQLTGVCAYHFMQAAFAGPLCTIQYMLTRSVSAPPLSFLTVRNSQTLSLPQDKSDDGPAGIRSTALLFLTYTRPILACFSTSSLGLISYAGYVNGQGLPFYVGMGASAIQIARILHETEFDSRESCWRGFTRCGRMGLFISIGLTGDYLWTFFNED